MSAPGRRPRRVSWLLRPTLLLLLLGSTSSVGSQPRHPPGEPEVHELIWRRAAEDWKGSSLQGHRIQAAFRSDSFPLPGGQAFGELLELDVVGPTRTWTVRCSFSASPQAQPDTACDFLPGDGAPASTFVLGSDGEGALSGPTELTVSQEFFRSEALQLFFARPTGDDVVWWSASSIPLGLPLQLMLFGPTAEERELTTLIVLAMLYFERNPSRVPRLDGLPIVVGPAREDRGQRAALARLEARAATRWAALLARHLDDPRRIDRTGLPYVKRNPWTARVVGSLVAGMTFVPGPEGAPRGLGGATIETSGGLRFNFLELVVAMGLHIGEVHGASFSPLVGGRGVGGVGFSVGLQARASRVLVADLEGVVGLAMAGRVRLIDVFGWGSGGATQLGGALAPILGLRYPLWKMNDLGSRLSLSLEGRPEWQFWATPRITAPPDSNAEIAGLRQGLSGSDFAIRANLGLQFDL
jgi:hypothetical protein